MNTWICPDCKIISANDECYPCLLEEAKKVVIVSYRMDRRGFRDTMFYTGVREYGVPLFDHDSNNSMHFAEDEAQSLLNTESWPDDYEMGTLPVMDSVQKD